MVTAEAARLAIHTNTQEITRLVAMTPVDHLAITQLQAENARLLKVITSAENLIGAAPHGGGRTREQVQAWIDKQFNPRTFAHI